MLIVNLWACTVKDKSFVAFFFGCNNDYRDKTQVMITTRWLMLKDMEQFFGLFPLGSSSYVDQQQNDWSVF